MILSAQEADMIRSDISEVAKSMNKLLSYGEYKKDLIMSIIKREPYEKVIVKADELIAKMALANTLEDADKYKEMYLAYLKSKGWDEVSFDEEMQRQVDAEWTDKKLN